MEFWDICTRVEDLKAAGLMAEKLGWKGLGVVVPVKDFDSLKSKPQPGKTDFSIGLWIEVRNPQDVKKLAQALRKRAELLVVRGGDLEINRAAVATPEVDVLLSPWGERNDIGVDMVMMKLARENNVAIGFDFRDLLMAYGKARSSLLAKMLKAARLVKKHRAPFVLTSGAVSEWDMRSPSELLSFGRILGLQDREIKSALSGGIIKENRKRLSGKWIMPGVEIE